MRYLVYAFAVLYTSFLPANGYAQTPVGNAPKNVTLPNGRKINPVGDWITLSPFPFALAVRPDGKQIVAPSIGWPYALNIIDNPADAAPSVHRIPPRSNIEEGTIDQKDLHKRISSKSDPNVQVHMGIAYSRDGKLLYDPTGDSGAVDIYTSDEWHHVGRIPLDGIFDGTNYKESFCAVVLLSQDGNTLYALDQGNWRVVVIDAASQKIVASEPTGVNPLAMALSPDGGRLYVTNTGLFEYKLISGVDFDDKRNTALKFAPFGYPSKEASKGGKVDGHDVPGLGDNNDPRGSSLWTYDVAQAQSAHVVAKLRLGARISAGRNTVVGGASPSGVVANAQHVYVSLTHQDSVAVISADGAQLEREIPLTPFTGAAYKDRQGRPLRGVMPFGLALSDARLYVAESGINSIAVINTESDRVLTHVPVGQYPAALAIAPDKSRLYVVNNKGQGTGPNNYNHHVGELELGSLTTLSLPITEAENASMTAATVENNEAALTAATSLPPLHHIFLIIRENRSFDEIFGDLKNANGDPSLARYSMHGWVVRGWDGEYVKGEEVLMRDVPITPNAHALADRFTASDNFYVNSEVSVDGHRWSVEAPPAPWLNLVWSTAYSGRRKENALSPAAGRRAFGGGLDAPMPEDEPEFGSMWEHIAGAKLPIVDYGEGLEVEGTDESPGFEPEGARLALNAPLPEPVFLSADRKFPGFNMGIPDQVRYDEFLRDFTRRSKSGYKAALTVIRLPNDHTDRPRPADGYPYRVSFVADNDLALGRIVETISHSSIWKDSAIFVYEDDSQTAADHVDLHRSPLLVISPYVKQGYVSHLHTSMTSIHKTIYELLHVGPLQLEDALSSDLSEMFTTMPDLAPYTAVPEDKRIFNPEHSRTAKPKNAAERARMLDCDDSEELARESHLTAHPRAGSK